MKRRAASQPSPTHAELMAYATAAKLTLDEARLALARQRHAQAMAKLTRKMEAN